MQIKVDLKKHTETKSKPKPACKFKNGSYVYITVHNCHTQHRAVLIIFPFKF